MLYPIMIPLFLPRAQLKFMKYYRPKNWIPQIYDGIEFIRVYHNFNIVVYSEIKEVKMIHVK